MNYEKIRNKRSFSTIAKHLEGVVMSRQKVVFNENGDPIYEDPEDKV